MQQNLKDFGFSCITKMKQKLLSVRRPPSAIALRRPPSALHPILLLTLPLAALPPPPKTGITKTNFNVGRTADKKRRKNFILGSP